MLLIAGSYRLGLSRIGGTIFKLTGAPGIIRECDYKGRICKRSIKVRVSPLFTILAFDSLDNYFKSTTGMIDGIGLPTFDCSLDRTCRSIQSHEPLDAPSPTVRS